MKHLDRIVFPFLVICLCGCFEKREKPAVETPYETPIDTLADVSVDTVYYGVLGEETGMSCLQLITDNGDTISIQKDDLQGVPGKMLGDVRNYEDRVIVSARLVGDEVYLNTFLNVSQLESEWQSNDIKIQLMPDSTVKATGVSYTHWHIESCKLLFTGEAPTEYGMAQKVDTVLIDYLGPDSLHLTTLRHGQIKLERKL